MKKNILILAFLIGLFAPTSIGSNIYESLPVLYASILIFIYLALIFMNGKIPKYRFIFAIGINLLIWIFTITTPFSNYAFGNVFFYLLFSIMICLNLKDEKLHIRKPNIMNVIHLITLLFCFMVIVQNQTIINFFINNYSLYYPEMAQNALMKQKPVIMFAAHSFAGLYLYLLFFISYSVYKEKKKTINLITSLLYIFFIFKLNSNAGYLFTGIAVFQLASYYLKNKKKTFLFCSLGIVAFLLINLKNLSPIFDKVSRTLGSDINGLTGRFSDSGILQGNLNYIKENPFRPIGFGNDTTVFLGDSGIIEYMLRGSLPLALFMYLGLFLFLKRNLSSKKTSYILFFALAAIDIGTQTLLSFRTLALLPLLIVFLNSLHDKPLEKNISKNDIPKQKGVTIFRGIHKRYRMTW